MPVTAVMFKGCCLWDPLLPERPVWTGQAVIHIKSRKKYNLLTSSFKMQKVALAAAAWDTASPPLGQCHELFFRFMLKKLLKFRRKNEYKACKGNRRSDLDKNIHYSLKDKQKLKRQSGNPFESYCICDTVKVETAVDTIHSVIWTKRMKDWKSISHLIKYCNVI